jgi:hypothetical protein
MGQRQHFEDPADPELDEDIVAQLARASRPPIPPAAPAATPPSPAAPSPSQVAGESRGAVAAEAGERNVAPAAGKNVKRRRRDTAKETTKPPRKSAAASVDAAVEGPRGTLYKTKHDHLVLMELAIEYAKRDLPTDASFILFDCLYRVHPEKRPIEGRHALGTRR